MSSHLAASRNSLAEMALDARAELHTSDRARARLRRRHLSEFVFQIICWIAIFAALASLVALLVGITALALPAFTAHSIRFDVPLDHERLGLAPGEVIDEQTQADFGGAVKHALRDAFPNVTGRSDKRTLYRLVSGGAAYDLRDSLIANPEWVGTTQSLLLPVSSETDLFLKGELDLDNTTGRGLGAQGADWIRSLQGEDRVVSHFNWRFFRAGDSREPELAGIWGALVGSLLTIAVTLVISFPLGVGAAVHLEEFAGRKSWAEIVEVSINNLAAVPSILFGLLGLAVFLGFFGMPRSAPLVGGLVLALMTLPTIIIAARAAMRSVPPSIRAAALGLGASPVQVVWHHVLPLAMPGILTGAILGVARALGETAPLLLIGMVAFVVDTPAGFTDPATALPVQIFLWADSPERGFLHLTAAAILVLLTVLVVMNLGAVLLRQRLERRWTQ